jgi:aminopeptidase N
MTDYPLNAALAASTLANPPKPVEVFRNQYAPLHYIVSKVSLDFKLYTGRTVVESVLTVIKNPQNSGSDASGEDGLVLDGEEATVKLLQLSVDGCDSLGLHLDYILKPGKLIIKGDTLRRGASNNADVMVVRTTVEIVPEKNTQLCGLYKSGDMYCTQCEAEGFRRITYYPDRPDVMATFEQVRVEANAKNFPVLLSNGNLVKEGICEAGSNGHKRKFAVWSDPYPKPSYLFALVAGDLGCLEDTFKTMSGRDVTLRFYSEHKNVSKLNYALESLKRAMKWDEDTFGLEYDLDLFNVVAVESFNMGGEWVN